jgi:hypothetical protein
MRVFNELLEGLMGRKKTEPIKIIESNHAKYAMEFEIHE